MKKQLLIIFFFVYSTGVEAQSWVYHPFPTDSAIWTNANGYWDVVIGPPLVATLIMYAPTRYCMTSADTVIGTNNYSKVDYCGGVYKGGLRDDGVGKIYFVPADSLNELLIYDFTAETGDTLELYSNHFGSYWGLSTYESVSVDSILVNGVFRKRINNTSGGANWVEGIGCTYGLFREAWANVSGNYANLDCMSVSDTTIYPTTSFGPCSLTSDINEMSVSEDFILYPNPTTGFLQIKTEQEINSIEVLDVFGRRILYSEKNQTEINISNFTNGIYFVRLSDSKGNSVVKRIIKN